MDTLLNEIKILKGIFEHQLNQIFIQQHLLIIEG